jgi:hypothetical protein
MCVCVLERDVCAPGGLVSDSVHLIGQWVIVYMFCVISHPNYSVYVNFRHIEARLIACDGLQV